MECCICSPCTTTPVGACDRYDRLPAACRCHCPCLMNALSPRAHVALSWRPEPVVTPANVPTLLFLAGCFSAVRREGSAPDRCRVMLPAAQHRRVALHACKSWGEASVVLFNNQQILYIHWRSLWLPVIWGYFTSAVALRDQKVGPHCSTPPPLHKQNRGPSHSAAKHRKSKAVVARGSSAWLSQPVCLPSARARLHCSTLCLAKPETTSSYHRA